MAAADPLDKGVLREMEQMTPTQVHRPETTHWGHVCQAQYTSWSLQC